LAGCLIKFRYNKPKLFVLRKNCLPEDSMQISLFVGRRMAITRDQARIYLTDQSEVDLYDSWLECGPASSHRLSEEPSTRRKR